MSQPIQFIRHDSELGRWETAFREPEPRLLPFVTRYAGWVETTSFVRRREVATVETPLIFSFAPLRITHPGGRPLVLDCRDAFCAGPIDSYVDTESDGHGGGIQVNFTPLGARMFYGRPMHELANRSVEFEDIVGPAGARLAAQLRDTPEWGTRFDVVERVILERFAKAPDIDPGIRWAWKQIQRSGGSTEIGGLCSALGRSRKQLIAAFREELGLAPKALAGVVRFSRAVDLLRLPSRASMADVAYHCGYFDQAHFSREFRRFAGGTPTEFVSHLLPDNGGFVME